jgi:hypothetical protein
VGYILDISMIVHNHNITKSLFSLATVVQNLKRYSLLHPVLYRRYTPNQLYTLFEWDSQCFRLYTDRGCNGIPSTLREKNTHAFYTRMNGINTLISDLLTVMKKEESIHNVFQQLKDTTKIITASFPDVCKDLKHLAIQHICEESRELMDITLTTAQAHSFAFRIRDLSEIIRFIAKIETSHYYNHVSPIAS